MASLATDHKSAEGEGASQLRDASESSAKRETDAETLEEGAAGGNSARDDKDADTKPSEASPAESGEASPIEKAQPTTEAPPLPNEPPPAEKDDGWDCHWDEANQAWFFHNRFTNATTWENPRVAEPSTAAAESGNSNTSKPSVPEPPRDERPPAGGYNPAIHGDYDPNAWYAQPSATADPSAPQDSAAAATAVDPEAAYAAIGSFNRFTGRWQASGGDGADGGGSSSSAAEHHGDEAKSRRQMNAFFDVDAAANSHDGRSLKAERAGKKPSKAELKQFKEKRRARKEEKRRAWLRD